jgi:coenzyme F420 hydrogenase subunit beta
MGAHINPEWLNIDSVVKNDLCTQCGACVAMCPHDNIVIERDEHWRFYPKVQELEPCVKHCKSLCVEICSGVHEDSSLWKKQPIVENDYEEFCAGPVLQTWIGYSNDEGIRSRGTSGGLITGLLVYLLESGKIDGALIIGPNNSHPLQHDIMIARTRAEIESSWGSKYYPMPLGERFDELIHKTEKYAVVLLGCHMRALRLMERRIPRLRTSVVLRIGIICGYCSGFKATVDQAQEWNIQNLHQITRIDYRDGKWPGNVRIQAAPIDKQRVIYEFLARLPFTTNHRCMICSDLMNETADITLGDAWLKELTTRKDEGWSVMAVRNPAVIPLIEAARADGALYLEEVDTATFIRSQEKPMRYKKHALKARLWFVSKIMRRSIPNNNFDRFTEGFQANAWNWIGNIVFMITMWTFFKRDTLRRAMYRTVPRKWIDWYVRSIFLMIAHDGSTSFLVKWLFKKDPAMNCDA